MENREERIRLAAFAKLDEWNLEYGQALPRKVLAEGFGFEGARVPLLGPQGIFKPRVFARVPLSITTVPPSDRKPRPYEDELTDEDRIIYKYCRGGPDHRDNVGLRLAMEQQIPLIYFIGLVPGWYLAERPAFVVQNNPSDESVVVQVDVQSVLTGFEGRVSEAPNEARRAYCTSLAQRRIHQAGFRKRVLLAYREVCAVCRLRHGELLDAAHIIPDREPHGDPVVPNGLSLCKLHHAAFDQNFLGIRPDRVIDLREDLLREKDGPMLKHGLQGFQGQRILVPRKSDLQPDPDRLQERYDRFKRAV